MASALSDGAALVTNVPDVERELPSIAQLMDEVANTKGEAEADG